MYSRNRIPANRSLMIGPMYQSRVSSQLLTRALLNFCSFPLSSQKCNCPLSFPSLDQQRNQRKLGRFEHKRVIIGPTLWPFLRANPRRQL